MKDESSPSRSWLEKLSHILSREPKDRDDLIEVLHDAEENEVLEPEALRMIEGVLQVSETQVRDIMISRAQMVVVPYDATLEQILPIVISSAHSRFPVIGEDRDEVVGILLAKDLLRFTQSNADQFTINTVMRPATFIPESKRLNVLLEEFRLNRNHIAIVIDEYGGVAGMLTIEDVLEQIVGQIEDEYDIEENQTNITRLNDFQYTVKALTPIEDFNEFFNSKFSDEEFDTIGGLVTNRFGHLPKRDEILTLNGIQFRVVHADKRQIRLLRVILPPNYPIPQPKID